MAPGDAAAGASYFSQNCATCHASDLTGIGKRYDAMTLRDQMLIPKALKTTPSFKVDELRRPDDSRAPASQFPAGELHAGAGRTPDRLSADEVGQGTARRPLLLQLGGPVEDDSDRRGRVFSARRIHSLTLVR